MLPHLIEVLGWLLVVLLGIGSGLGGCIVVVVL